MRDALQTYADAFTWAERPNGERYCKLKADAPDWIDMEAVHAAVDSDLYDDWVFASSQEVATVLAEEDWGEDVDVNNLAAASVDIGNALFDWIKSPWARALYDEGIEMWGYCGLTDSIQNGQFLALERIAYEILRQCREQAEEER